MKRHMLAGLGSVVLVVNAAAPAAAVIAPPEDCRDVYCSIFAGYGLDDRGRDVLEKSGAGDGETTGASDSPSSSGGDAND